MPNELVGIHRWRDVSADRSATVLIESTTHARVAAIPTQGGCTGLELYSGKSWVAGAYRFPVDLLTLVMKRRWIWGF